MSRTGLFDSHAHMDSDYFTDDRDALLTQLQEELDGIINPGCDEITSGFAVSLAEKYDFMYAAVGWHPEDLEGILDNSYVLKICIRTLLLVGQTKAAAEPLSLASLTYENREVKKPPM